MTETERARVVRRTHPVARRRVLRTIAAFEAIKGIAALAAIVGVLDLMHHDARHLATELIGHFGLNPDAHYPSILLHYADQLTHANVRALVLIASGYILVRLLEAYGIWNDRAWGEWLGAFSGGLYIPVEVVHMMHRPSVISAVVLSGNVLVVIFLAFQLWRRRSG
jgi:uncharacterized membrane protein (DUF2068 family)